jgi:hypothetical protein
MFSALLQDSDMVRCRRHVSNVPIGDMERFDTFMMTGSEESFKID